MWLVDVDDVLRPKQPISQETPQEVLLKSLVGELREERDKWRGLAMFLVKASFPER
jgi:hypothetical protein